MFPFLTAAAVATGALLPAAPPATTAPISTTAFSTGPAAVAPAEWLADRSDDDDDDGDGDRRRGDDWRDDEDSDGYRYFKKRGENPNRAETYESLLNPAVGRGSGSEALGSGSGASGASSGASGSGAGPGGGASGSAAGGSASGGSAGSGGR